MIMTREEQLEVARGLITSGIDAAYLITGSALSALEEVEIAMGRFLAMRNAETAAEIAAIETQGNA